MQALEQLSSQIQLELGALPVQQTVPLPASDDMSCHPHLNDVRKSDCETAIQPSASYDSSHKEAQADTQSQFQSHQQTATALLRACHTPPTPAHIHSCCTPPRCFCVGRITNELFKLCQPADASSHSMSCNPVQVCTTNCLPNPAGHVPGFNYQHWPVASTSPFSPPAEALSQFCTWNEIAFNRRQCETGSEASTDNSISCNPARLRKDALHCRRCNVIFDRAARLQNFELDLLPVTLRDPQRQACHRTAVIPEAGGASSPEVRAVLVPQAALSDQ